MELEQLKIPETESIKLIKNTKGYSWEIKILGADEKQLEKLRKVNAQFEKEYGGSYV